MSETAALDLPGLGREAAAQVPGLGKVEKVLAEFGVDSADEPAAHFSFLIDEGQDLGQVGIAYTRLIQRLRDELLARGYEHYPFVQVLSRADWERRFAS